MTNNNLSQSRNRELAVRASKVIPGGTSSSARVEIATEKGYSKLDVPFIAWSRDARICDVDGKEYIDYLNGWGPVLLGHRNEAVNQAVINAMDKGTVFGMNHLAEIELAEKIVKHVPSADMVRLVTSGSNAVTAALRIARNYTRKEKFIRFVGHYHGWHNHFLPGSFALPKTKEWPIPGIPNSSLEEAICIPWNDLELIEYTLKNYGNQVAAILCEPIMCDGPYGVFPDDGYLEGIKKLAEQHGCILIFDEIITGFRVNIGGAQALLKVTPDLTTFGKAMGNGFPISAIVGKRDIMEKSAQFIGGTYNGSPISVNASLATMKELEKPGKYEEFYKVTDYFVNGMKKIISEVGIEAVIQGPGPVCGFYFTSEGEIRGKDYYSHYERCFQGINAERNRVFFRTLWENGVLMRNRVYLNMSMTKEDIDKTLSLAKEAFIKVKEIKIDM